jgi:hypothetical protein
MATKVEPKPAPEFRETLPIAPRSVQLDFATHTRRYWVVTLDPAITLDDIGNRPEIWRLVQADRNKALGPNDCIELRGDGWIAEAKVNEIDSGKVYLFDIRKANRPSRTTALFEDDHYKIGMVGSQFAVYRKRDNSPTPFGGKTFATADAAKAFIFSQYPQRVA